MHPDQSRHDESEHQHEAARPDTDEVVHEPESKREYAHSVYDGYSERGGCGFSFGSGCDYTGGSDADVFGGKANTRRKFFPIRAEKPSGSEAPQAHEYPAWRRS